MRLMPGLLNLLNDRMWPRAAGRSIHSENQPITELMITRR